MSAGMEKDWAGRGIPPQLFSQVNLGALSSQDAVGILGHFPAPQRRGG